MLHHGRRAAPEHEGLQAYASKCCARCLRQRPLEICKGCGLFGFCSPECRQAGAEDHAAECGALPKLASLLRAAGGEVWHDGDALHNALLLARVLRAKPRPDDPIAKLASPLAGRPLVLRTFLVQPRLAIPVAIARAVLAAAEHWPALLATPARARPPRDRQEWPPEPPPGSREPQVEVLVGVLLQQQVNACCIFDPEVRETMGAPPGEGVFPEGALTNHSCSPNCQFMYRLGATPLQYVLCVAEVATGEELTVSYGDVTRPVWERRPRIESSHWFRCSCARCEREVKRQGLLDPSSLSRVADVRGRVLRSALSAAASHGGDPCTALEVAGAAFAPAADDRRVAAAFREFQEAKAAASKAGEVGVQSDYLRAACRTLRSLESVMHPDDSALLAELRSRANLLKAEEEEQAEEVAFNWQEGRAMVASLAVDDWVRRVTILGDDLFVGTASSGVRRYRVGEQSARQRYEVGGDPMQAVVADHPAGSDPETSVTSLSFDGRWLAAGLAGGRLHIWAAEGGEPVLEEAPADPGFNCFVLFVDGHLFAAGGKSIRRWTLSKDTGKFERDASTKLSSRVHSISQSSAGGLLVGLGDGTLEVRCQELKLVQDFNVHNGPVSVVAAYDRGFVTGAASGQLVRWNLRGGDEGLEEVWRKSHSGRIVGAAFGGGDTLISGALDGTVRAWDFATGESKFNIPGHKAWLGSICTQANGGLLVTDGRDNAVYMYDFRGSNIGAEEEE
mmetsp:Transcript_155249/g.498067  ORF Transcript_155249/g.498067 Transcript_155249/m.498067 type:complete len:734 (+) Transcript_155249:336-2537(+)